MGRSPCCPKDADLNRGAWTAQEDKILSQYLRIHGEGGWRSLPKKAGLKRCGKSCRLRWLNYLRPDIKRGNISQDEEELIIRLHGLLGNRWSLISGRLPGRTDNEIKNYWNTHLSKKLSKKETISPKPQTPHSKLKLHPISSSAEISVLKTTPVKANAVRISKQSGCSNTEAALSMKDSELLDKTIMNEDSDIMVYKAKEKQNIAEIKENSPCIAQSGVGTPILSYLNDESSSPDSDFISSPCNSSKDFRVQEFSTCHVQISCSDESNVKEGTEEICEDWVDEMEYLQKWNMQPLSLLLLESEEDWEERSSKHGLEDFTLFTE